MKKAARKSREKERRESERSGRKSKRDLCFILLILIATPLVLYWQATDFELVWDDGLHLSSNPHLDSANLENLGHFWKEPFEGLYIPVTYNAWTLINALGTHLFSGPHDPTLYHAANILLHTLNGLLVFALLRLFIKSPWAALAGALLFVVHPVQVESVAYASEFRGLLAACFGFAALLLYAKGRAAHYGKKRRGWPLLCSSVFFFLAVLSKPSAAVLPLLAASLEIFLFRPSLKQLCSRSWLWLWVAFSVAIAVVTSSVQESNQSYPFWAKPLIWMDAISFYLYKLLLPLSLASIYGRTPEHVMGQWWIYVIWAIPVGMGLCLWHFRKKAPLLILAAVIFLLGFLPVSGLKGFTFQSWSTVADRYLYLSMLGVALGIAYAATRMERKWQWSLMAAVILLLGTWSFSVQVPVWENSITLWSRCIEVNPGASRAYNNRAAAFNLGGQPDRAITDLNKSLAINPDYAGAYNNRAVAFNAGGKPDRAITDLNKALAINPDYAGAYNNRGIAFARKQEHDRAISDFSEAIARKPNWATAYNNRGITHDDKQEYDRAISDFNRALSLDPNYVEAYFNRGNVYNDRKEYDRAIADFDRALSLHPGYAGAYLNRGVSYYSKNEHDRAIEDYSRALALNPNNHRIWFARGVSRFLRKEYRPAISDFSRVVLLKPGFAQAYINRAKAYYSIREYGEAFSDLEKAGDLGGSVDPRFLQKVKTKAGR
jgi:tetratricopeptide (TPR) repeat protein